MQRVKTSARNILFLSGDVELNPGPENISNISVLTTRLARIGRKPVNIVGDGNCFFRSISHQLYGTETRHAQIRANAIQHLILCPEYFIESNTEQSWSQYLQNMSKLGSWADHIIIQAVANINNLRIHITESSQNFNETTIVTSIYAQSVANVKEIYIGHLEELHYVSTTLINQFRGQIENQIGASKTKLQNSVSDSNKIISENLVYAKTIQKRRKYMKEYMKNRRMNNEFKKKESERKKSYNNKYKNSNDDKVRDSWQKATATYRQTNPEKVKESFKIATATYRQSNPEKVKQSSKRATAAYRETNPEKVKQTFKAAKTAYRQLNPKKVKEKNKTATGKYRKLNHTKFAESSKLSNVLYKHNHSQKVKDTQKRQYMKRKLDYIENGCKMRKYNKIKDLNDNLHEAYQITGKTNDYRQQINITKALELFHKKIGKIPGCAKAKK
ncbi:OTU domain-containing protein 5-like [Dendronephthya gigantea]|uniref:OTU domain-containing protein 5-like n=1 Tax=Dendronephthya gigantea TaxID=151771 RepID=UPI00106908A4|nr:OTU domain-containing protein 5-like [Dendronephthya gigantea]